MTKSLSQVFSTFRKVAPGLGLTIVAVVLAYGVALATPGVSPLIVALALGIVVANLGLNMKGLLPGLAVAARPLLRFGIVLLGLKVSIDAVVEFGIGVIAAIVICTTVTFLATIWIGRMIGLEARRSLLIAAGVSICGASAVAAMDSVVKGKDEDVTAAVGAVSLLGLVCVFALPMLQEPLGLSDAQLGLWAGLGVHEVAQVVATAAVPGAAALAIAVPIKLGRVLLLAPILAGSSIAIRRGQDKSPIAAIEKRPPLVPLFVVGFVVMVAISNLVDLPSVLLTTSDALMTIAMSAAMFAIGASVGIKRLLSSGGRMLVLGLISTVLLLLLALSMVVFLGVLE